MHRYIMRMRRGDRRKVDHKNHDTLDNRRSNLRVATSSQNGGNRRKWMVGSSRYKGVTKTKDTTANCWLVRICVGWESIYLGRFKNEREAARAYDVAARKHFGRFAHLNFPTKQKRTRRS